MYKKVKKHENTVFGYKKGSKTKSENLKIFFDPKLYIETFCIFEKNLILFDIFEFFGFSKDFVHFFSLTTFFFFLEFINKKIRWLYKEKDAKCGCWPHDLAYDFG